MAKDEAKAEAKAAAEKADDKQSNVEGARVVDEQGNFVAIKADAKPDQVDKALKDEFGSDVRVSINPDIGSSEVTVPDFLGQGKRVFRSNRAEFLSGKEWDQFRQSGVNADREGRPVLIKGVL